MEKVKIYAKRGVFTTQDKELIATYKSLNSNSMFADSDMFKQELMDFSQRVREEIGMNNIISFTYDDSREALIICVYDATPKAGETYVHGFDELGFYIFTERPQGIGTNE